MDTKGKGVDTKGNKGIENKKTPEVVDPPPQKKKDGLPEVAANLLDLTNILPAQSEQVVRFNFANIFDPQSLFYEAAFKAFEQPPFSEKALIKRLSFSPLKVDELIQAERFTGSPWSFTVVHVMDNLEIDELIKAFNLEPVKDTELKIPKKPPVKENKDKEKTRRRARTRAKTRIRARKKKKKKKKERGRS